MLEETMNTNSKTMQTSGKLSVCYFENDLLILSGLLYTFEKLKKIFFQQTI